VQVAKETVARLRRVTGRHAERCHAQPMQGLTPRARECDEPWSVVKKSRNAARATKLTWGVISGLPPPLDGGTLPPVLRHTAGLLALSSAGRTVWLMGR
jgi:hypothetical protein